METKKGNNVRRPSMVPPFTNDDKRIINDIILFVHGIGRMHARCCATCAYVALFCLRTLYSFVCLFPMLFMHTQRRQDRAYSVHYVCPSVLLPLRSSDCRWHVDVSSNDDDKSSK